MTYPQFRLKPLPALIKLLTCATFPVIALGQTTTSSEEDEARQSGPIDEITVTGRLLDSSRQLVEERKDDPVVVDLLGAMEIGRIGDSTVAVSLRRVAGLTLVNDEFVYVRGLGERYSSATLNGARIPSPDLTRSVIPLDIFPTSIVDSLRIQKAYSADMPANFGGGNIDIRTRGVPSGPTASVEVGVNYFTENDSKALTYAGGGSDNRGTDDGTRRLNPDLLAQINARRGRVDVQSILNDLRNTNPDATRAEAEQINRELGLLLNRDLTLQEKSTGPDYDVKVNLGSNFLLSDDLEIGASVSGNYGRDLRQRTRVSRAFGAPDLQVNTADESKYTVDVTGVLSLGANYLDEHSIDVTRLFLRNTDDVTTSRVFFNENAELPEGRGFGDINYRFEQRDLKVLQFSGSHLLGPETRRVVPGGLLNWLPVEPQVTWFVSESDARTFIPNEVQVDLQVVSDPLTGAALETNVTPATSAADFRFTTLDDEVNHYGWGVDLPLNWGESEIIFSGGAAWIEQGRLYSQTELALGSSTAPLASRTGELGDIFSDARVLDPANGFVFSRTGTNNQSYVAATKTDAVYGKVDWNWRDTYRVTAGLRWEDYRQVALDFDPFGFTAQSPVMTTDVEALERAVFQDDDIYPSVSLLWNTSWLAETFQLRFGWSETVVRPDLRELTVASYLDPLTNDLIRGNPGVRPSPVSNFDVRGEWFFSTGDNLSVSLFYKDIDSPIEFFETAASDTTIAREIINAESATIYGVEIEGLLSLGTVWSALDSFFLRGNATFQEAELIAGDAADAPTNNKRDLTNAAPYIVNLLLGYDSDNGRHAATVAFNTTAKRLFVAGRRGAPDGFQQPFYSLDATYSWYPTENLTLKASVRNILGDDITIERLGVQTFEQKVGQQFGLGVAYKF